MKWQSFLIFMKLLDTFQTQETENRDHPSLIPARTLSGFLHPLTVGECCRAAEYQLQQLQQENKQLEMLRKNQLQQEIIWAAVHDEISFQEHLRAKLETLKLSLTSVELDVETEMKNRAKLNEALLNCTKEQQEMERNLKSCRRNIDVEKTQLKAEEMSHKSLLFQHNIYLDVERNVMQGVSYLKRKIIGRRNQLRKLQEKNASLASYIQRKRAKVVSKRTLPISCKKCMAPHYSMFFTKFPL